MYADVTFISDRVKNSKKFKIFVNQTFKISWPNIYLKVKFENLFSNLWSHAN